MYIFVIFINNNNMNKIKNLKLLKIFLFLANILLLLIIVRECKITRTCFTIISLISPIFFGFALAWVIKPIMLFFNKKLSTYLSTILTYVLIILLIFLIGYVVVPIVINEVKNLLPFLKSYYYKLSPRIIDNINITEIGERLFKIAKSCTFNIKTFLLNAFYSLFMSFFFLTNHKSVTNFISKRIPARVSLDITTNLRLYVKGTILDTVILFIMSLIGFKIVKMPYIIILAIFTSITNVIPFIGPYIGGVPAVLVSMATSFSLGIKALIVIVILQFIESSFIHPYIMSKSLKINPIVILIGLIIFGYFWGILGLLISTPLISIIKCLYEYYKLDIKKVLHR